MSEFKLNMPKGLYYVSNSDSGETITLNKAQYDKLQSDLKKAVGALESYANEQNWKNVGTYDGPVSCVIVESDQYAIGSQDYGGKLARLILKELRGEK